MGKKFPVTYIKTKILINLLIFLNTFILFAQTETSTTRSFFLETDVSQTLPNFFSTQNFKKSHPHPRFALAHKMNEDYFVAIFGQFRFLRKDDTDLALFSAGQRISKIYRLTLNNYFGVGGSLFYILPSQTATLPLEKNKSYLSELGIGAHVSYLYISDNYLPGFLTEVGWWRGTKTSQLIGFEVAVGLLWPIL